MRFIYLAVFGVAGVYCRYGIDVLSLKLGSSFPWGTLGINLLGSFLAGALSIIGLERVALSVDLRVGLMVGFLGGFTTFSAYTLQTAKLMEDGSLSTALFYGLGSPALGLISALFGMYLARVIA